MVIHKYNINDLNTPEIINLPVNTLVSNFKMQQGEPVFWACVDEDEEDYEERKFALMFTGKYIEGNVIKIYNTENIGCGLIATLVELEK